MKKLLFILTFVLIKFNSFSQVFGNEWIKTNQIYYKFKIVKQGIYKIDSITLAQLGINLNGINPNKFQIIKNGEEQFCYTSGTLDGVFNATDYIAFYADRNDGKLDLELYKTPADQPHQFNSLYSDTAVYFFSIIPNSAPQLGKRFNNFSDFNYGLYAPENYFINQLWVAPLEEYYRGEFRQVGDGEFYYYSDYLKGESWMGSRFGLAESRIYNLNTPNVFTTGPSANLKAKVFGVSNDRTKFINHHLRIGLANNNGGVFSTIKDTTYAGYIETFYDISLNNSLLGNTTQLKFETVADLGLTSDFNSLSYLTITYPSLCALNGQSTLYFKHRAQQTATNLYFQFTDYGKNEPQLIDLQNNNKIACTLNGTTLRALLPNTGNEHQFYIFDETDINLITKLELVDMNFLSPALNSQFVIISNNLLASGANAYKLYRSQKYNTNLVFSNDLYNQFFYGYEHPLAVKHFLAYLYQNQVQKPAYVLLLGRGYQNNHVRNNFQNAYANNLVPAIGEPSSDNLFTKGLNLTIPNAPAIATGRVPALTNTEVFNYLDKLKQYEKDTLFDIDWRKQVLHLTGGSGFEQKDYTQRLNLAKNTISQDFFGANVTTYNKNTSQNIEVGIKQKLIGELNKGKSLMTFLGHGSLSVLDVDFGSINDLQPSNKYTFYYFNGCNIGNANDADPMGSGKIYGKDFLVAPNKGAIGWLAHSNITLTDQLYSQIGTFYGNLAKTNYGLEIGKIIQQTIAQTSSNGGVLEVSHGMQLIYQGDPALKLGGFYYPDYEIDNSSVFFTDKNLTALADSFEVNIIVKNLGKAVPDSLLVSVLHQTASNGAKYMYDSLLLNSPMYMDTLTFMVKGQGKSMVGDNIFTVKVDFNNAKTELNETNNEIVVRKFIVGSGINTLMPLNYAIVNKDSVVLEVQNNDLFSVNKEYIFEIDNTKQFDKNSPFYQTSGIIKANDLATWSLVLPPNDSTVYFWRARLNVPELEGGSWVDASFTKINAGNFGFMQSNFDQYRTASLLDKLVLDTINKQINFVDNELVLGIQNKRFDHRNMGVIVPYQLNEGVGSCIGSGVVALVFEPFQVDIPYELPNYPFNCNFVQNNKENRSRRYYPFSTTTQAGRDEFRRFIDSIPTGYYVAMFSRYNSDIENWDAATLASLNAFGLEKVNKIKSKNTGWAFISVKNAGLGFAAEDTVNNDSLGALVDIGQVFLPPAANQPQDSRLLVINKALLTKWFTGSLVSVPFGPANSWSSLNFNFLETDFSKNGKFSVDVIGLNSNGLDTVLYRNIKTSNFNLSSIDALRIPYLKLKLNLEDSAKRTPHQFGYWQVLGTPVAEAKLAPALGFKVVPNPIYEGDSMNIELGIQNIGAINYDSNFVNVRIVNDLRQIKYQQNIATAPLLTNQGNLLKFKLPTLGLSGNNQLQFTLNYDKKVQEVLYNNNFITSNFTVKNDKSNPYLDVTFDGVKIMNGDIVSASPTIQVSSLDNNKFILQKDTSLFTLMLRKPNGIEYEKINFNSAEIQFLPANNQNNKAVIIYKPTGLSDGKYALKVFATDALGIASGTSDFEIEFTVINKASITNFFPYPNPATTNIRFVFTLTGSALPDDLLIRIMTITGKVVKEINKYEFGNIKFGNNISEYAWDGNDMYGDRLANGVYLYQVFSRINKQEIENRKVQNTDKFFLEGVGKIYLMR